MRLGWFRPVHAVAHPIGERDLLRADQPSLFMAVFLSRRAGDDPAPDAPLVVSSLGTIDDVGFASGWNERLSSLPPRNMNYCREFYWDRFFAVQPGDTPWNIAWVEIKEELVEDQYRRGRMDYTGFGMVLTLRPEAYPIFGGLVGIDTPRTYDDRQGFVLRIPTKPFAFPAQRGSHHAAGANDAICERLRRIKRFKVPDMAIARVNRRTGAQPDSASILDRYEILSATRLTLEG